MMSWIAGIGYDFRTNNDIFLNSLNVKYYTYGMNTHMSSIMSSEAEKVDMLKRDFGISNALRYRFTPDFMGKFSVGYDVRLPAESELLGDGYAVAPSGNLLPERNTSINLGFLFDRTGKSASNLQLELNTFYGYDTVYRRLSAIAIPEFRENAHFGSRSRGESGPYPLALRLLQHDLSGFAGCTKVRTEHSCPQPDQR